MINRKKNTDFNLFVVIYLNVYPQYFDYWQFKIDTLVLRISNQRGSTVHTFQLVHVFCPYEQRHEISNNVVCVTSRASDQPAHMHSLISAFKFASYKNIL